VSSTRSRSGIINVADPTAAQDAATKNYVDTGNATNRAYIDAKVLGAGNVPAPGASIGYWLKSTGAAAWAWAQVVAADITDSTAFGRSLLTAAGSAPAATDLGKTLVVTGAAAYSLGNVGGSKNKLIACDFTTAPWQRGSSFNGTAYTYGADRWQHARSGFVAGMTVSKQTSGSDAGFFDQMRIQRDSGNASASAMVSGYSMETVDAKTLAGRTVTLAVRGQKGANFSGAASLSLYYATGTDQNIVSGSPTGLTSLGSINVGTGFVSGGIGTTLVLSVAVPSNATQLFLQHSHTPSGTAGAADYIDYSIIQLEDSPVFTGFERRTKGAEQTLCERYFEKSFPIGTAPAQATGLNSGELQLRNFGGAGSSVYMFQRFATRKRVSPTMTFYNPGAANGAVRSIDTASDCTGTVVGANTTDNEFNVQATIPAGAVAGNLVGVHWTASAEL
jgi:hypothetical protein